MKLDFPNNVSNLRCENRIACYWHTTDTIHPIKVAIINLGIQTHMIKNHSVLTIHLVHTLDSSKILSSEAENFSEILSEWLPRTGQWSICWRAGQHGWRASTFHENCDGKNPTLTLVKVVKNGKNLTFGGYATQPWDVPAAFDVCECIYDCCF